MNADERESFCAFACIRVQSRPADRGTPHEIPAHLPHSHAGRRRPAPRAHRLHGLEGSRQRARSAPHLSPAGQGSAPGRIPGAVEESGEAGLRVLGRIRAEFRRPPHPVRALERDSVLGTRAGRESVHSHLCRIAFRTVHARHRDQRRAAHRRGFRSLDRKDHAQIWPTRLASEDRAPRNPANRAEDAVLGGSGPESHAARFRGRFDAHYPRRHEGLPAARLDAGRARSRKNGARLEVAARQRGAPPRRRQHSDLRRNGLARNGV